MKHQDERHGSRAGYDRHRRAGEPACERCTRAAARYEQERQLDLLAGRPRIIDATGTRRRVQALAAIGYTFGQMGEHMGRCHDVAQRLAHNHGVVRATTAEEVAAMFRQLAMVPLVGWKADQTRRAAVRRGWVSLLAWDDIDDPSEQPNTGRRSRMVPTSKRSTVDQSRTDARTCPRCGIPREARKNAGLCRDCKAVAA
jgi:hypothetical protein